jgi:putative NADH-flavin reductase
MRVVVFGAGGRVGQRVVEYAHEAGHEVRAVVRNKGELPFTKSKTLHIDLGDVLAPLVTQTVLRGANVVVSAIGNRNYDEGITLRTDATRQILEGMNVHGVPRLILVSAAGILPYKPGVLRGEFFVEPGFEHVFADHKGAWEQVEKSGVDYTLACPPKLTNGMRLRYYRREINGLPEDGREISPEDAADFIVDALGSDEYRRARVGIAY